MPQQRNGAQRASSTTTIRALLTGLLAALLLMTASAATAPPTRAAASRVVIVVGPVGSATREYKHSARKLARLARSYGAAVTKVFSPNATWRRVRTAAQGANLLIYLGHGNGWPSPYAPFSANSKDGFGLNRSAGNGNRNLRYYGESYMAKLNLAQNAVVVLNRLCYASGNNEWGAGNPKKSTAKKRVDNYGSGFLEAGAKAVYASGITSVRYVVKRLFKARGSMTLKRLFWTDPNRTRVYDFRFASLRTPGATAIMDPYARHRYYRSVIGFLHTRISDWRSGT